MAETARVAVLIDCDNVSYRYAHDLLVETASHGTLSVKRAYGDFAGSQAKGWTSALPRHAIQPVQQFAYTSGKNATDSALIIDAMDLLYTGDIDVFCIVSSDSDFTRLAMRLRESGKLVYGIGEKKTPESFCNACDRFTYLEVISGTPLRTSTPGAGSGAGRGSSRRSAASKRSGRDQQNRPEATAESPSEATEQPEPLEQPEAPREPEEPESDLAVPDLPEILRPAIRAASRYDDWAPLGSVGWHIVNNNPTFDSRNYGYAKLGILVRDQDYVKVKTITDDTGVAQPWVRLTDE